MRSQKEVGVLFSGRGGRLLFAFGWEVWLVVVGWEIWFWA